MWRRFKWPLLATLIVVVFAFRKPAERYFDIARNLDIFATLFKEVNAYYVDEIDPEKLIRKGIDAMLESLDPYTDYIPEDEIESFRITTTGQYGGIGALIGIVNKRAVITHPYKDFPAFRSGIRVGDEIIAVDGKNVQGKSTSEISALLKGQPRSEVEVTLRRVGKQEDIVLKIKREKINISNVAYSTLIAPDIAYIKLDDFTPGASREVSEALVALKEKGAKKVVLDLRDNPGGLLHEAVNVVSLFIPKGMEVVSTRGKVDEWNKKYNTLNTPVDTESPIVVLTSGGSASAAEIVAGALQDYDRAVLVGEKTFGKGLVQTTRPLSYNSQLKVTTAKYYIPSGRCIQAMDYTHRQADGTVHKVADSLKVAFKTKNGRAVFDGGGLDPDIETQGPIMGPVAEALVNSGLTFEYASLYCSQKPAPADFSGFKLSDKEYDHFVSWVKGQNFRYVTGLERSINTLLQNAKKEKFYPELESELLDLRKKIQDTKENDLHRFKSEIAGILEGQIAFHYALAEGEAQISLGKDAELVEARKVLSDPAIYKKLLSPRKDGVASFH